MSILMQFNANIGIPVELASWLRPSVSTGNTTVKSCEETERR
jgi:hypothetical protein